jgi:hypothetical protein
VGEAVQSLYSSEYLSLFLCLDILGIHYREFSLMTEAGQKPSPKSYHQMEDGLDMSELPAKGDATSNPVELQVEEESPADHQSKPRIAIVMVALSVGVHAGLSLAP